MITKSKLYDILAVQCLNIIMIARKVMKWVMVWFATIVVLTTSMLLVGGDHVKDTFIAMNMFISAVVVLGLAYLFGLSVSILFKYIVLGEDSKQYLLRSVDKIITTFSIIGGTISIYVPIVEDQVAYAISNLIFYVGIYLFLSFVKPILIYLLPEKLFVKEKNEYVSKHLKYSWLTFEDGFYLSRYDAIDNVESADLVDPDDVVDSADLVDPDDVVDSVGGNVESDELPVLYTGNSIDLPTGVMRTGIIPKSPLPITHFRDTIAPINDPAVTLKYPIQMVGPVNTKLPFKHTLRIIGPKYKPYALAPRVLNMLDVTSLDDTLSDDTLDDDTLDGDTLDDATSDDNTSDDNTSDDDNNGIDNSG